MIYEFECSCGNEWTERMPIAARNLPMKCGGCGVHVQKREIPSRLGGINGAADWDTAHYNHGLGQGVRNNLHANQIAKSRGMTALGNDDVDRRGDVFKNDKEKSLAYDISEITNLGEVRSK
jgi:hypothetical protein